MAQSPSKSIQRKTFQRHAAWAVLRGPAWALAQQNLSALIALKSFGATDNQAILLSLAMPIGNISGFFWSGQMMQRRRVPFAIWPDFLGMIALMAVCFATSAALFIPLVMANIVLRASSIVAFSSVVRENYPAARRAALFGTIQAFSLGSLSLSSWLAGEILNTHPEAYRIIYPAAALLGMLAVLTLRGIPEEDPSKRRAMPKPRLSDFVRVMKKDHDFFRYELSFFTFGFAAIGYSELLPLYLERDLGASYREGAIALGVITTALPIITAPFWGRVLDRTNILVMRGVFNFVWALSPLSVILIGNIYGVYLGQFFTGCILGGSILIWNLGINIFAQKDEIPLYMGIHQALTGVRGLLAPITGLTLARMIGTSEVPAFRPVFACSFVVMVLSGAFMIWEGRQMEKRGRAVTFAMAEDDGG